MGHLAGKDVYRELGRKIDGLTARAPWNEALRDILKELYSEEEADLVTRMPYRLATLDRLERVTGYERARLERVLEQLSAKGLVLDLCLGDCYRYMPSPFVIGIFEFTMMRTGAGLNTKQWARLFHRYIESGALWQGNLGKGQQLQLMRSVPHEDALAPEERVEVLDYEKASAIIESQQRFAVGLCSCRHEKLHVRAEATDVAHGSGPAKGNEPCRVPLESCTSMGHAVDYLVRRKLAREISRTEMLERVAQSKELGLVMNADNVQRKVSFICHCCGCCCNVLLGISRFGYPHVVVTSSYMASVDDARCEGCGKCKKACPIGAIGLDRLAQPVGKKRVRPLVDERFCLGCGVCAVKCTTGALRLKQRGQRVLHPETTFERTLLQCLELGTLQNQLFDDPGRITHQFMRAFVGAVLRLPPVKKALLSDTLRSRFLGALKAGAAHNAGSDVLDA
jgi:Fe-S-cluster-containing hydrogenase component 2